MLYNLFKSSPNLERIENTSKKILQKNKKPIILIGVSQRAFELRDRVSDRERYYIEANHYAISEKTYDKAIEALEKMDYQDRDSYNQCADEIIKIFSPEYHRKKHIYLSYFSKDQNEWQWNL